MRSILSFLVFIAILESAMAEAFVDPALNSFAEGNTSQDSIVVLALLSTPTLNVKPPYRYHRKEVLDFLRFQNQVSWESLREYINDQDPAAIQIQTRAIFSVNNSASFRVTPEGLEILKLAPQISKIYANRRILFDRPVAMNDVDEAPTDLPYNFVNTKLNELMKEFPEINGSNVVVGQIDTGVDEAHPALKGKLKVFYDARAGKTGVGKDSDGHGTYTAGTILGGDRSNIFIGMAPEAKLVAAGALTTYEDMVKAMQWIIDPDGNSQTADAPRAISNSWNTEGAPDQEIFYRAINAWEASGILPVFSAGNAGPRKGTITKPHEYPGVIAVAAAGPDGQVASFSSRGPAQYKGKEIQKPDCTAPGVNVISAFPGGKYKELSGTSMAAPHVTGAVALLLQANAKMNPADVRAVIIKTLTPVKEQILDDKKWDPAYGFGSLDILEAVRASKELVEKKLRERFKGFELSDVFGFVETNTTTHEEVWSGF